MKICNDIEKDIKQKIAFLFGESNVEGFYTKLMKLVDDHLQSKNSSSQSNNWVSENDVFLITYGDSLKSQKCNPLMTLNNFLNEHADGVIEYVHILPFYPYSSDDGFSVIDYFKVNEELGDWNDVKRMSNNFKLMFDAVINHISAKSDWFQGYLNGESKYKDYFIEAEDSPELAKVFRPRALPLLTEFATVDGKKQIWTTFSEDQIDLNYKSEDLFLKIVELLLFYVKMGAKAIRLDAIGFMWKELGTSCMHLPQTHEGIKLFRDIFKVVAPETLIITETNVPHKDNISYFGNGHDEAQMVYQFPLPPLVLYSMITGNAGFLSDWASKLELASEETTFFNFLASHDGIGIVPTHGILSDEEREKIIERVQVNGGFVSYKTKEDGSKIPYEMNINYFDAVSRNDADEEENIARFICSQAIMLSVVGVPAIYIHSLLGSGNYIEGVKETGRNRTINREKLNIEDLLCELENSNSKRSKVFTSYKDLLKIRKREKAFHPNSQQKVLKLDDRLFALVRGDNEKILVINNVSEETVETKINLSESGLSEKQYKDLVADNDYVPENGILTVTCNPYQVMWLK